MYDLSKIPETPQEALSMLEAVVSEWNKSHSEVKLIIASGQIRGVLQRPKSSKKEIV